MFNPENFVEGNLPAGICTAKITDVTHGESQGGTPCIEIEFIGDTEGGKAKYVHKAYISDFDTQSKLQFFQNQIYNIFKWFEKGHKKTYAYTHSDGSEFDLPIVAFLINSTKDEDDLPKLATKLKELVDKQSKLEFVIKLIADHNFHGMAKFNVGKPPYIRVAPSTELTYNPSVDDIKEKSADKMPPPSDISNSMPKMDVPY